MVTGKAKVAVAESPHCGAMYKDALKTLERMFGQPQAVVTAYSDKLVIIPPVKMHNSESIISYSVTVSSLVGIFRSLNYVQDLSSPTSLGQAVLNFPPNMKEAWSMHTVKHSLDRPTMIEFNDWLKDEPEAHERMKTSSGKVKVDEKVSNTTTKSMRTSKSFSCNDINEPSEIETRNHSDKLCSLQRETPSVEMLCVQKEKHPQVSSFLKCDIQNIKLDLELNKKTVKMQHTKYASLS